MYIEYNADMEIPISQFRRDLFSIVEKALDGKEVWVRHKGRRVRLVPEDQPSNKLRRITSMEIITRGVDIEDGSWKSDVLDAWERKWDRRLGPRGKAPRTASSPSRTNARKARGAD
jgi:antitoxin (DNA-binding transcriptional repressor) of toxin-antitoxin stability system